MTAQRRGRIGLLLGSVVLATTGLAVSAHADTNIIKHSSHRSHAAAAHDDSKHPLSKSGKARYASGGSVLQCVPFARAASGIALKGNAANWWDAAAGVYQRGNQPEPGSVLNFRANGHMRLGHVAVVREIVADREIVIDHANWTSYGGSKSNVSRGVRVIDVSAANDWSAVRVELGRGDEFGSVYPTYGFIYDRPDTGTVLVNARMPASRATEQPLARLDEVAEAPSSVGPVPVLLPVDAPDRGFR